MIGGSGHRMELRFWRGSRYRSCESLKYDRSKYKDTRVDTHKVSHERDTWCS